MRECSGAVFSWIGEPPNTPLSLSLSKFSNPLSFFFQVNCPHPPNNYPGVDKVKSHLPSHFTFFFPMQLNHNIN